MAFLATATQLSSVAGARVNFSVGKPGTSRSDSFVVKARIAEKEVTPPSTQKSFAQGLIGGGPRPDDEFDPLGLSQGKSKNQMYLWREAELTHGRVAMLATVGFLVQERWCPFFGGKITGPAITHFQQVPSPFWQILTLAIAIAESYRLQKGWVNPSYGLYQLRDDYYPGDLGYDPLGIRPTNPTDLANMQTKELNNGRLAMIGIAGMVAQELVSGTKIFPTPGEAMQFMQAAQDTVPYLPKPSDALEQGRRAISGAGGDALEQGRRAISGAGGDAGKALLNKSGQFLQQANDVAGEWLDMAARKGGEILGSDAGTEALRSSRAGQAGEALSSGAGRAVQEGSEMLRKGGKTFGEQLPYAPDAKDVKDLVKGLTGRQ
eukprot:jgi/Mesvir1/8960/Mv19767-RA.1